MANVSELVASLESGFYGKPYRVRLCSHRDLRRGFVGEVLEVGCRFSQKIDGSGNALAWLLWGWQQNPSDARLDRDMAGCW